MSFDLNEMAAVNKALSAILTTSTIYLSVFQHPMHLEKLNFLHVHGLLAAVTTLRDEKPPFGRHRLRAANPVVRAVSPSRLQGAASGSVRPHGGSLVKRWSGSGKHRGGGD